MAKKFTEEVLDKLDRAFQPRWNKFEKCLKQKEDWDPILNDQAILCHRQAERHHLVVGRDKIKKHMKEKMPNLKLKEHQVFVDEYPAEIATGAVFTIDGNKIDVLVKHNAIRVDRGTFQYNPEGEYTAYWIHQDECGWELIFMDFRDGN
jgi:hypothetical protein